MKVKELMAELSQAHPDSDVTFAMADGCCGDYFILDEPRIDCDDVRDTLGWVRIDFPALDFLVSCRMSGAAQSRGRSCK